MAADQGERARRRLLADIDRRLRRQGLETPHEAERREREERAQRARGLTGYMARAKARDARTSQRELYAAIKAEGGITPNRDYAAGEIPSDLRHRRGQHGGLAPDEMADTLRSYGFHYDGDVELMADLEKRRLLTQRTREEARPYRRPMGGIETICYLLWRNPRTGEFEEKGQGRPERPDRCADERRNALGEFTDRDRPHRRPFYRAQR